MNAYDCPFCGVKISDDQPRVRLVLIAFEAHLDVHMVKHDPLLADPDQPSRPVHLMERAS